MKAAQINEYGDASVIQIAETDKPALKDGQVLVEVYASSINPFDVTIRSGYMQEMIPLHFPVILGGDIAGVVSEVGAGVSGVMVGDKVFGQANAVAGNSGAMAEFAVTAAGQVAKAPGNLDFKQAASLPLVGVSALQALNEHIKLASGQKLLITGGSGGIGSIAVQVAKHLGAQVVATATGAGLELAKQLGADKVIDYKAQDLSELERDFDAAFDTVGGDTFVSAMQLVKPGGAIVTMAAQPDEAQAKELEVTAIHQMTKVTTAALDTLRELVESGTVTPQVDKVFALADTAEAFRAKEGGEILGKVVIEIKA